jgi:ferredoxin, 2Fe-2S
MPKIVFVSADGATRTELDAPVGTTILELAHKNNIELEGACEGALACSTCHVIIDRDFFDLLPEPSEEEEDMLDLAFGLKLTSRLGCQIVVTDELEGLEITLPAATRNMMVS